MISNKEVFDSDLCQRVTLKRYGSGSYVDGIYQPPTFTTKSIIASIQQPSLYEIDFLQSGEKSKDVRKIYTKHELRVSETRDGYQSDVIVYSNREYRIIQLKDFGDYDVWSAFMVRLYDDI